MTSSDWAAWAEVLVTAVAVGVAIWVPARLHGLAEHRRQAEQREWRKGFALLLLPTLRSYRASLERLIADPKWERMRQSPASQETFLHFIRPTRLPEGIEGHRRDLHTLGEPGFDVLRLILQAEEVAALLGDVVRHRRLPGKTREEQMSALHDLHQRIVVQHELAQRALSGILTVSARGN